MCLIIWTTLIARVIIYTWHWYGCVIIHVVNGWQWSWSDMWAGSLQTNVSISSLRLNLLHKSISIYLLLVHFPIVGYIAYFSTCLRLNINFLRLNDFSVLWRLLSLEWCSTSTYVIWISCRRRMLYKGFKTASFQTEYCVTKS